MTIAQRLEDVRHRITAAAEGAGRDPESVRLIAISKTFSAAAILEARAAGQSVFGENRAQEFAQKARELPADTEWHFVGHLQTNKVRLVVGTASLVHSVDSIKLAEAITARVQSDPQAVLIEVNVSGESAKHGVNPEDAVDLATEVAKLDGVEVRGLMTIPPYPEDPEESRPYYKQLAALGLELRRRLPGARELSMGMTRDFDIAVAEGATLVRVGEAIFGSREG